MCPTGRKPTDPVFPQCFGQRESPLRGVGPAYDPDMGIRVDCRHYSSRTVANDELVQRCRVDAAEKAPFACPEDCLFFEPRSITDAGWSRAPEDPEP